MKALTYPLCLKVSQTPALEGAQCSSQEEILIRRDNWQIFSFYVCNVYMPGLAPDAALNLQRITSFHSKVGKVGRAEGRAPRRFVLTILNQQYNVTRPWAQKPLSAGCLHLSGAVGFHHHRRIISTSDDHLIPYWVTPPYVDLSYLSHPCRACLLGNVCHGVLPPLARPTLGRTQASPDAKPLLPFHLLPRFTDVSTVGHLCCHPNCALLPLFLQRKSKLKNPSRSLYHAASGGVSFVEKVCLRGVIFQYTDAWASCPHLSKYITSDAESYDIFHTTRGAGRVGVVGSWCLGIPCTRVCPRCLWRVKVERASGGQVQAPKESQCVRQGWGLASGLRGYVLICSLAVWCMHSFSLPQSV